MKKKIISIALFTAILSLVIIGGSMAYFTDIESKTNVFTVGDVDITLTETEWDDEEPHVIIPGAHFDKNPTVENTGSNPAYLRVKITLTKAYELSEIFPCIEEALSNGIISGFDPTKWVSSLTTNVFDPDTNTRTITLYYNGVFNVSDQVTVFTDIDIPTYLDEELDVFEGFGPSITVIAEAIQAEGFSDIASSFAAFDASH